MARSVLRNAPLGGSQKVIEGSYKHPARVDICGAVCFIFPALFFSLFWKGRGFIKSHKEVRLTQKSHPSPYIQMSIISSLQGALCGGGSEAEGPDLPAPNGVHLCPEE